MSLKKIFIMLFLFISIISFSFICIKTKAMYVFDNSTIIDGINNIENELKKNDTDPLNEYDRIIEIINSSCSIEQISMVKKWRNEYEGNRKNIEDVTIEDKIILDISIYTAMAFFSSNGSKLSLELLIRAYCASNNEETYDPYYKYILSDYETTKNIVHNNLTSGSDCYKWYEYDGYTALRKFNYTKAYSKSTTIHINDKYDFDPNDSIYIYSFLGKMNQSGYLPILNLSFDLTHNFSNSYKKNDDETHIVNCGCGKSYTEEHNFRRITKKTIYEPYYDANSYKCSKCNYIKIEGVL